MASPSKIVRVDAYRTVAFGSISGTYAALGTPFTHPMRLIKIVNTCDTAMNISFDGTTNNDFIPAGSFALYDLTANQETQSGFYFQIGTQVYVKQATAPSSGAVYLIALYGQGE
jgi:hypothetical protein